MSRADIKTHSEQASVKKHIGIQAFAGTFGTNLLIQACTVLQGILIARMLGPIGRGEFAAVTLWPQVFGSFGVMGIFIAIGRIAAKVDDYASLVRSGITFAFVTSVISATACYIAVPWILPESESHLIPLTRFFILIIPLLRLIMNLNAIDQGRGNFKQFNLIRGIFNPVYVTLLVIFWFLGIGNLKWCVNAFLLGNLAAVIVWMIQHLPKYPIFGKLYPLKDIFNQSIPFSLAGIFQSLYLHVDKALMLWLLGTKDLGLYTVALSASAVAGSITVSTGMVAFTMAAHAEDRGGFERLAKTFRISLMLWIFFGGMLALVMPFVLPLVYGQDFEGAVTPARILIAGSALAGLANMLEQSMRGQGKAFIGLEGRLGGIIVLVVLAIPLSKMMEILGICYAFIVAQFVCLSVIIWRTNTHYCVKSLVPYLPRINDVRYLISTSNYHFVSLFKRKKI